MALNDWINRQSNIDSNMINMSNLFDEAIRVAQKKCIDMTAQSIYDNICKIIASKISTSSIIEGDVEFPRGTLSYDVQKDLSDIIIYSIPYNDRLPFFQMADKKIKDFHFITVTVTFLIH